MSRSARSGLERVTKPQTVRDLGPVDTAAFERLLDQLPESFWEIENARKENDFSVFHHTQHLILRFVGDHDDPRTAYSRPVWTIVGPQLEPAMRCIAAIYGIERPEFPKAMFARLAPNAIIDPHVDAAFGNLCTRKIHVPIRSSPEVLFEVNGERMHLAVGHAYEVNNVKPHGAKNMSSQARVHFIFEVFDPSL